VPGVAVAVKEAPPAAARGRGAWRADSKQCAPSARADETDGQLTGGVGDVLQGAVGAQGVRGAPGGGAAQLVLGVLAMNVVAPVPSLGREASDRRGRGSGRAGRWGCGTCLRGRRVFGLARTEDEEGGKAEQDRRGECQHRPAGARVKGSVEEDTEALKHGC
jgi:hypothetical protein